MRRCESPSFSHATPEEIVDIARSLCESGYSFANICATKADGGNDVLYAFRAPDLTASDVVGLTGYNVHVPYGIHMPSISEIYPAAFVFENEAHDLFGVEFDGITIDYGGEFYSVAVTYPMNIDAAHINDASDEASSEENNVSDEDTNMQGGDK